MMPILDVVQGLKGPDKDDSRPTESPRNSGMMLSLDVVQILKNSENLVMRLKLNVVQISPKLGRRQNRQLVDDPPA